MRTRTLFAASAAAIAIAAAGVVGVASADGPATPANRTVTVMGDASLAVKCDKKGGSDVDAMYREALAQALAEAQDKAGFIAGKVGATLGAAQSVTENGSAGDPCAMPIVYADPAATGLYAHNAYDCVNLVALAAVAAGTTRGPAVAAALPNVSSGGTACDSFADCVGALQDDRNIDYDGPSGALAIGPDGDPTIAVFELFTFDEAGRDVGAGTFVVTGS